MRAHEVISTARAPCRGKPLRREKCRKLGQFGPVAAQLCARPFPVAHGLLGRGPEIAKTIDTYAIEPLARRGIGRVGSEYVNVPPNALQALREMEYEGRDTVAGPAGKD